MAKVKASHKKKRKQGKQYPARDSPAVSLSDAAYGSEEKHQPTQQSYPRLRGKPSFSF